MDLDDIFEEDWYNNKENIKLDVEQLEHEQAIISKKTYFNAYSIKKRICQFNIKNSLKCGIYAYNYLEFM